MRLVSLIGCLSAFALAAGAAHAADSQLSCKGDARVMPADESAPLDVQVTIAGGLEGPTGVTYVWARPESPVAMNLKGLIGETLLFHGMAQDAGGVLVADVELNRTTLALSMKVRRLGSTEEDITLQTVCRTT